MKPILGRPQPHFTHGNELGGGSRVVANGNVMIEIALYEVDNFRNVVPARLDVYFAFDTFGQSYMRAVAVAVAINLSSLSFIAPSRNIMSRPR